MKFILNGIDKENVKLEDYIESLHRAKALADNPEIIYGLFGDKEYSPMVDYSIQCHTDNYADEFYVTRFSHKSNMEQNAYLEILTSKSAMENEIEEIKGKCVIGVTEEDIPNYKLGKTVQSYTQIGNTDYWYREI